MVFDPTRWDFENKKPYLYVGDDAYYDEGGNRLRGLFLGPVPKHSTSEAQITFPKKLLPSSAWEHIKQLVESEVSAKPRTMCVSQVRWLANNSVETLQPHAASIYKALQRLKLQALIPIDNRRKVERLQSTT
jgi:hypothetical protein